MVSSWPCCKIPPSSQQRQSVSPHGVKMGPFWKSRSDRGQPAPRCLPAKTRLIRLSFFLILNFPLSFLWIFASFGSSTCGWKGRTWVWPRRSEGQETERQKCKVQQKTTPNAVFKLFFSHKKKTLKIWKMLFSLPWGKKLHTCKYRFCTQFQGISRMSSVHLWTWISGPLTLTLPIKKNKIMKIKTIMGKWIEICIFLIHQPT